MKHGERRGDDVYWTNLPALTLVERLEAACHQVILPAGGDGAKAVLRHLLPLGVGSGLNPLSPAANLVRVAEERISSVAAILDAERADPLALRVATARLCRTLTNLRGELSGGRRTIGFASRPDA